MYPKITRMAAISELNTMPRKDNFMFVQSFDFDRIIVNQINLLS